MREHSQRGALVEGLGGKPFDSDAAFLASIVENSDDAIISKDLNGVIMSWNCGAERIFGYSAAEAVGKPVSILIPPDHADEEPKILERIRRGERIEHYETVRRRKDGSMVDVSLTVSPIKDADGRVIGASKIARETCEQRRVLEQLRQSEERYRVTLASIGDAVISTDNKGRVTFMNAVAEEMTAWEQNEALAIPLEKVFPIINEITRRPVENPVARALREGKVVGLANHTILISRDGKEWPIDDSGAPIRGQKGDVRGVVLVFRDATKQRAAELTARKLTSIVENSDDAIIGKDLNGVITSWNRGAEHIFGYSAAEAVGKPVSILIPPDHADEEPKILERIRRGERIGHYETVRQRKDGTLINVSLSVSPIKDADGRVIGVSKIARDITQHKRMEKELVKANAILAERARDLETAVAERTARLQQTIADLETFSYTVSHDLRSPLRAMQGFAQAIIAGYADKLDAEGKEYLQRISSSAIRMDKLILEVLTYSRIEIGRA